MDHIALIDAARRYRVPEQRDQAEIDLDRILCGTPLERWGKPDAITLIEYREDHAAIDEERNVLTLYILLESGISVAIPCNW
jgi:hypothetical protein